MIKKLDKLIVKAFVGPFIATLFITSFVLVLQFFWLYIDDIVGKGIDLFTILKFVMYVAATVVPLALPLAVLLSSIMTFGNLGETFELVAIKSAGIPLLRFMRPLFVTTLFICGVAFMFNNYIIPVCNLRFNRLKYDIINKKPAFDLKEGSFYTSIPGYAIKVGKKEKDDSTVTNVVIYEKDYNLQDNFIVADKGVITLSPDKRSLIFKFKNGWRYQERGSRGGGTEYIRLGFKEFQKSFDMSSFLFNSTSDSAFKNNWQMLSVRQLSISIDSVGKMIDHQKKVTAMNYLPLAKYVDSGWAKVDSVKKVKSIKDIIPDSAWASTNERLVSQATGIKSTIESILPAYDDRRKELRYYKIGWHQKFSMSLACLVLFFIGAPLGSIIRKGGIGMPLVFAVIFFVVFFLLNNFGQKFVKEDVLTPFVGMWMATFVLVPVGAFLTYKAMRDSQLFNKEFYHRIFKQIGPFLQKISRKKNSA
ncbi:LptF/LptG family permease [Pinibacter soli]|uniref:LptF/LptG family permease n=1 Tax=Pinibacter soli TaxID=3044211 RepID=A0ABT6R744_9BACT|nr:LptF/LptG family permease [Pinibacter soli]MDI3318210.1 LptF/LptG family permease [Pinibacter soli]